VTQAPVFPRIANGAGFVRWRSAPENWMALVQAIAQLEGIPARNPAAFGGGTNLVIDLDGRSVLKLFPPFYRGQFDSERATLRQLAGRLAIPIPALIAEGESDGWCWLIVSRLEGIVGSEVWPALTERDKERVLRQIGKTIAGVQAVPLGALAEIRPSWPDFLAGQVKGCVARHRAQGLAPHFLSEIPALLADVDAVVPGGPCVILTGEWIPENFLLAETGDGWSLAAVIDFGDVMTGWKEYDLLGPIAFMCAGKPGRVRSLIEGYGLSTEDCDAAMRRRLLLLMLLHGASDLRNVMIDGWETKVDSLHDLNELIWNTADD